MADGATTPADPVDWGAARFVAHLVARRDHLATSYLGTSLVDDFDDATRRAALLVAEFTGLHPTGVPHGRVVDRAEWVDANVDSLRRLLTPVVERIGNRSGPLVGAVGSRVAGAEAGALLGYLSHRVLGQYDLLVPDGPGSAAELRREPVYYVGPNVLALEKRFAFRPRDFRLWIALHEVTHWLQFTAVPWLRPHFTDLVGRVLGIVEPDPRVLLRALGYAAEEVRRGRNPLDRAGWAGLLATEEQRAVLHEVQALMSVLEGHGNYVMNELGRRHVHGEERMERVLGSRRRAGGVTGVVNRLLGLDVKLRQYEAGERFVRGVVDAGGPGALDAVWAGPDAMPTLDELEHPDRWLGRVGSAPTVGRSRDPRR